MKKQVELAFRARSDMLILKAVLTRRAARLWCFDPPSTTHGRPTADSAGLPLPGVVPPGEAGPHRFGVGESENKRKAKFYKLTAAGRKQLKAEAESWNRFSGVVASVLGAVPEGS